MVESVKTIYSIIFLLTITYFVSMTKDDQFLTNNNGCFCKLQGEVDDCSCKVESLDSLNNRDIYPRLRSLLARDYFRYYKVNLHKECPFWPDDSRCAMRNCAVDICPEENVPSGLKEETKVSKKYTEAVQEDDGCSDSDLGYLNTSISTASEEAFKNWTKYDDAQETFCEVDDDSSPLLTYVDLLLNTEKYTGYKGESPHRIWNSIYKENCFKPDKTAYGPNSLSGSHNGKESHDKTDRLDFIESKHAGLYSIEYPIEGMCLEKRAFYRLISGLHTSINIHLCAEYMFPALSCFVEDTWGPNLKEFQKRFDPQLTDGHGPQRLKNLYFTYLMELRALAKAAPYLEQENFFTGSDTEDEDVKEGVKDLLKVIRQFPEHFDERKLFKGKKKEVQILKREFREHFLNISRIMDCVGCDKCKLWGKLQIQGMGTALKILFSGDGMGPMSTVSPVKKNRFQLRRQEIVALFNAFGRLSSSIHAIEEFRHQLR